MASWNKKRASLRIKEGPITVTLKAATPNDMFEQAQKFNLTASAGGGANRK